MPREPSTRTGLIILAIGVVITSIGVYLTYLPSESLQQTVLLLQSSQVFSSDIGVGIIAWGVGWITSSLNPLRKYFLIPVTAGIIIAAVTFVFRSVIINIEYYGPYIYYAFLFSIPPALISSGIISGIIIARHIKRNKLPRFNVHFEEYMLYAISASLFLPFVSEQPFALLRLLGSAIACWIIWHFISPRLAGYLVIRRIRNSKGRLQLMFVEEEKYEEMTFTNIFSKVYYPLAFGLGVSLTILSIIELLPPEVNRMPPDPIQKTAQIAIISILAVTMGSAYVGPVVWLFSDSGIRIKDNVRIVIEEPKIHSLANQMIEIYSFIQAPISFAIAASGGDYAYAFGLLALLMITILTASLLTTVLYIKVSSLKNLKKFISMLKKSNLYQNV